MGLFDHKHVWRMMLLTTPIEDASSNKEIGRLLTQECITCDAIRNITIKPGSPPIVCMAEIKK